MATPPPVPDVEPYAGEDQAPAELPVEHTNGTTAPVDEVLPAPEPQSPAAEYAEPSAASAKSDSQMPREKQVKPNKVYVGGLPEHTRSEDLQNCFGKLGAISNIELKVGYGFVEFESREAAEQSVDKYNEGYFMGNKIKVELSHGGGRTAKYTNEPGACFKCGSQGHWARECPHHGGGPISTGANKRYSSNPPVAERMDREYHPRDIPPPRDYRRFSPPPPPRDYPPPMHRVRDYDYDRRGPPPPLDRYPPPPGRYGAPLPPPPPDFYRGYGPPPPPPGPYERFDRRPPPMDRAPGPPGYPPHGRMRSPPRFPDYDRPPPPRDYPDYRARPPMSPPSGRYDYPPPPRAGPDARYR